VRLALWDPAGAVEFLSRSVRSDPDDGVPWLTLGVAYARLGSQAEACAAWRQVLALRVAPELQQRAARLASSSGCPGTGASALPGASRSGNLRRGG